MRVFQNVFFIAPFWLSPAPTALGDQTLLNIARWANPLVHQMLVKTVRLHWHAQCCLKTCRANHHGSSKNEITENIQSHERDRTT